MKHELSDKLYGTDVSKEISLLEYGLLVAPKGDECFVVYRVGKDAFANAIINESDLNRLINGLSWASYADINGFLNSVDSTKEGWLQKEVIFKIMDLVWYWGMSSILGECIVTLTENEAIEAYL